MHARLLRVTPSPSSVGQGSPTSEDVESFVVGPDGDSRRLDRKNYHHDTRPSFKHLRPKLSPPSDTTSDSSEDELYALPGLPPLRNLSHCIQRARGRFKPYDRHSGHRPDAIELRFFRRLVGKHSGENELNLADVQAGKELFQRGLRGMSPKAVAQAVAAMRAARETKRLRVLTTAWEIESSIQQTKLLEEILEQDALEYASSSDEDSSLKKLLVGRTSSDLEVEVDFNIGMFNRDLTSYFFTVFNQELAASPHLATNSHQKYYMFEIHVYSSPPGIPGPLEWICSYMGTIPHVFDRHTPVSVKACLAGLLQNPLTQILVVSTCFLDDVRPCPEWKHCPLLFRVVVKMEYTPNSYGASVISENISLGGVQAKEICLWIQLGMEQAKQCKANVMLQAHLRHAFCAPEMKQPEFLQSASASLH
ncbi:hypothetical protein BDR07DRAFT_1379250 [Suillus spraguei]|nr:hypothetical protein BDR07DRAFT_1382912 [Suillus spraguei]KAG2358671.1 hypothetical protein BDR07DRAFT_1379250 [Suillus spraguei]